jgi:O-6-methylguanine DNA methyltransferase
MVRLHDTPLGRLDLYFTVQGLSVLEIVDEEDDFSLVIPGLVYSSEGDKAPGKIVWDINATLGELNGYFHGTVTSFSEAPLDLKGTPFQLQVWQELGRIPWAETITYQELASRLGKPQAARAVGQACGANPIPIIIPCHRVIASNGTLGGYSSGLERKRWLLKHEGAKGEKGKGNNSCRLYASGIARKA